MGLVYYYEAHTFEGSDRLTPLSEELVQGLSIGSNGETVSDDIPLCRVGTPCSADFVGARTPILPALCERVYRLLAQFLRVGEPKHTSWLRVRLTSEDMINNHPSSRSRLASTGGQVYQTRRSAD